MPEHERLDEVDAAALVPEVNGPSGAAVRLRAPAGAPPAAVVVQNMTSLADLSDLALLGAGLVGASTRATDSGGLSVQDDDVIVWDAGDVHAVVSRSSLTALFARLVSAAVERRSDLRADDATWAELEELRAVLAG